MVLPDNPETDSFNHYNNDDSSDYPNQIFDNPQFLIDNDNANILNNGYQPLGSNNTLSNDASDDEDSSDSENEGEPNSNLSSLPTADSYIELELWNNPRPSDVNIELDNKKTQEIISAMASISLPNSAVPQWAQNIPEDKWKDVLMEKIREKK